MQFAVPDPAFYFAVSPMFQVGICSVNASQRYAAPSGSVKHYAQTYSKPVKY